MKRISLIDEINELLIDFSQLDLKDVKSILSWFYKGLYYNSMYDNEDIANYLYNELKAIGYEETETTRESIRSFYRLLSKATDMDEMKIANALISQIMTNLKKSQAFDESLNSYIKFYNEKFNSAKISKDMMESLKKNIGSRIVFVKLSNGKYEMDNGVIDAVEDFKSVIIDKERFPFIGYNTGIKTIYSIEGKYLYNNELLSKETNLESLEEINEANQNAFGSSYNENHSKLI